MQISSPRFNPTDGILCITFTTVLDLSLHGMPVTLPDTVDTDVTLPGTVDTDVTLPDTVDTDVTVDVQWTLIASSDRVIISVNLLHITN